MSVRMVYNVGRVRVSRVTVLRILAGRYQPNRCLMGANGAPQNH